MILAALAFIGVQQSPVFQVVHIGSFPADLQDAFINKDGAVAFNLWEPKSSAPPEGYYWKDGKMTVISAPFAPESSLGVAGLSDDGTVTGAIDVDTNHWGTGYTWTKDAGMITFSEEQLMPTAINPLNDDVYGTGCANGQKFLVKRHDGVVTSLVPILEGSIFAVNRNGVAIASYMQKQINDPGFSGLLTGTQAEPLAKASFPPYGKCTGGGAAINSDGWVVGGQRRPLKDCSYSYGAIWSPSNELTLVPGNLWFRGINDAGYIVGYATTSPITSNAIIFDSNNRVRDLNMLIPPGMTPHLSKALAINNSNYIVCIDDTGTDVYLLKPVN